MIKWKLVGIGVLLLVLVACGMWHWERVVAYRAQAANAREEALQASLEAQALADELCQVQIELDEVQDRPPSVEIRERVVVKYQDAPAQVVDYMASHKREIKWTNPDGSVRVHVPDAMVGDTVEVKLDTDIICKPWIERCAALSHADNSNPELSSPLRWGPRLEIRAGYGYSGLDGEVGTWPVEIGGSRFKIQIGAYGRATMRPDGDFEGNAAIGLKLVLK